MVWNAIVNGRRGISEWRQKRKLMEMLKELPRSANGHRSIGQLEKGIDADRATTERLLLAMGARKTRMRPSTGPWLRSRSRTSAGSFLAYQNPCTSFDWKSPDRRSIPSPGRESLNPLLEGRCAWQQQFAPEPSRHTIARRFRTSYFLAAAQEREP